MHPILVAVLNAMGILARKAEGINNRYELYRIDTNNEIRFLDCSIDVGWAADFYGSGSSNLSGSEKQIIVAVADGLRKLEQRNNETLSRIRDLCTQHN